MMFSASVTAPCFAVCVATLPRDTVVVRQVWWHCSWKRERERERESIELGHDGLPTYPARVADALLVRCPDVSARIADISIVSLSARRAW